MRALGLKGVGAPFNQDRLGSAVLVTDGSGFPIERYTYSPYGESGPEGDSGFPFRFTGQKLDARVGLYHYKARYYDPETGRFLQTDPIGYADQMNLYAYVANDPVNATDPLGMASCSKKDKANGNCPDINPISNTQARELASAARSGRSPNSSLEGGAQLVRNRDTGETRIVSGREAGRGTGKEFSFSVVEGAKRQAVAHTHTKGSRGTRGTRRRQDTKSNNGPSTDDQDALDRARVPIITVGPDVTTQLFRKDGQDYVRVEEGSVSDVPDLSKQDILVCGRDAEC